ncbi:MAG: M14 family metallopeptidase [Burkholderiales bacterium]
MTSASQPMHDYLAGPDADASLTVLNALPEAFFDASAASIHQILPGPTLIHLQGRRAEPVFVSTLLHGNEDTGLKAMQALLAKYQFQELPRSLSLFIGNVRAAAFGKRLLDGQPDYNRVWPGCDTSGLPEHSIMQRVTDDMRERGVWASIDIHNNTGLNPHYACVRQTGREFLHLAALFTRIVVYFERPLGVQTGAFSAMCPSVTVECGKPGNPASEAQAASFVEAVLHLDHFPEHPLPTSDIDLYHTVGTVKVQANASFTFGSEQADIRFPGEIDHMNFRTLPVGTVLGQLSGARIPLDVWDESGRKVTDRFFEARGSDLVLRRAVVPAMITLNAEVIRQDCFCYFMEHMERAD